MPYYEFTCDTCELTSMLTFSINEDKQATCHKCRQPMRRSYSSPAITFKGTGFYTTDKRK